uniref:Uncharacterized protein n=1 Tax=Arundo donax TaxID=35708 RepID=A0A0A9FAV0_ARUDO
MFSYVNIKLALPFLKVSNHYSYFLMSMQFVLPDYLFALI